MKMLNKNLWGAANSGVDPQRADLFRVTLALPAILGGEAQWQDSIEFAVTKFAFPDRMRNMIEVKWLNQTNYCLGADAPVGEINIPIRYAFNQPTAQLLEKWHWMTSNPRNGGGAVTSAIKSYGYVSFLVPDVDVAAGLSISESVDALKEVNTQVLEGVLVKNLKYSELDTTQGNNLVTLDFTIQIDRYYPANINNMVHKTRVKQGNPAPILPPVPSTPV